MRSRDRDGRSATARADSAFRSEMVGEPAFISRAPGRVNVIGEHVDYNDGYVLPVAIDRDIVVLAAPTLDNEIHVIAADNDQSVRFSVHEKWRPGYGWQSYVRGVAQLLSDAGVPVSGANLVIAGDLVQGAGMSSSAALVVAVANAFLALAETSMPPLQLIELARRVEQDFAGVACGIMDPFASVCGAPDRAIFLDCRSLDYLLLPIPENVRVIATDSGVRRELHDTAYNDRVRETREAASRLGVRSLRDVSIPMFEERAPDLPDLLQRRARHVVQEISRTRAAADALEHAEMDRVGALLRESHETLRSDYDVSTPELDALVDVANGIPGVYGSRLSGAGFGGCTVSLVHEDAVIDFVTRVPAEYEARTGLAAVPHVCRAAAGASVTMYDE
jgi:galactokinase